MSPEYALGAIFGLGMLGAFLAGYARGRSETEDCCTGSKLTPRKPSVELPNGGERLRTDYPTSVDDAVTAELDKFLALRRQRTIEGMDKPRESDE